MAARTRRDMLALCADENALLLPCHFEAPHVARVRSSGDRFTLAFGW